MLCGGVKPVQFLWAHFPFSKGVLASLRAQWDGIAKHPDHPSVRPTTFSMPPNGTMRFTGCVTDLMKWVTILESPLSRVWYTGTRCLWQTDQPLLP
jgi:hypothetical protein